MSRKATLGYPSRTDAVLALRAQGHSTADIAARVGIRTETVTALEISALRRRVRPAMVPQMQGRAILISIDVLNSMRRASSRRGLTPHELARLIIETVVDNDLIDAVLDDVEAAE